jgi:hypothetical protein
VVDFKVKNPEPKDPALGEPCRRFNALSSLPQSTEMTKNSKSQTSNNKQITMTEIRNPKPLHHLKIREFQTCFGHWILEFVIYLRFGAWDLLFEKLVFGV